MVPRKISVDPDLVASNVTKITTHIEQLQALSASQISHHTGASVGVTANFHQQMAGMAAGLPQLVTQLRTTLLKSEDAIKQTVADLVAKDDALAADATAMLAGIVAIDNVPPPPAAPGIGTGTSQSNAYS